MAKNKLKLYALPASHPCDAVEVALKLKSIPYDRVDLLPSGEVLIGPLLWRGKTVPGVRVDRERLVGSRTIMRKLDQLAPEPPLLPPPGDPTYARVLELERWGEDVLQSVPRRILDVAFVRRPPTMLSYIGDAKLALPLPLGVLRPVTPVSARLMAFKNKAREDSARADLRALPGHLERIDGWIEDGLLGGEQPNAADLQIGSTIRLLLTVADLRELIGAHRAVELTRYFPPRAGEIPAGVLPADWVSSAAASA
jgi:glutathione S-transferase